MIRKKPQYLPSERLIARSITRLKDRLRTKEFSYRQVGVRIREFKLKEINIYTQITALNILINHKQKLLNRMIENRTNRIKTIRNWDG